MPAKHIYKTSPIIAIYSIIDFPEHTISELPQSMQSTPSAKSDSYNDREVISQLPEAASRMSLVSYNANTVELRTSTGADSIKQQWQ